MKDFAVLGINPTKRSTSSNNPEADTGRMMSSPYTFQRRSSAEHAAMHARTKELKIKHCRGNVNAFPIVENDVVTCISFFHSTASVLASLRRLNQPSGNRYLTKEVVIVSEAELRSTVAKPAGEKPSSLAIRASLMFPD
jgi:hypothetical protein